MKAVIQAVAVTGFLALPAFAQDTATGETVCGDFMAMESDAQEQALADLVGGGTTTGTGGETMENPGTAESAEGTDASGGQSDMDPPAADMETGDAATSDAAGATTGGEADVATLIDACGANPEMTLVEALRFAN